MIHVLGKVSIQDLPQFISVFSTRGAEARRKHGSYGSQLFRVSEKDNQVVVLFEWESREAFESFLNDPLVKETMKSSGAMGPPEFTLLEKIGMFPS
jgi:heme-degrading monooxygenase HmoA